MNPAKRKAAGMNLRGARAKQEMERLGERARKAINLLDAKLEGREFVARVLWKVQVKRNLRQIEAQILRLKRKALVLKGKKRKQFEGIIERLEKAMDAGQQMLLKR